MRFTALLLLLIPVAASAQYSYDYTSGPISSALTDSTFTLPAVGSDITGVITLSQELPESGTVTVTPLTTEFMLGDAYSFNVQGSTPLDSFTFTTQNGVLTSFSFGQSYNTVQIHADSASNYVTSYIQSPVDLTQYMSVEGSAGSFSGPGLRAAPEIDPDGVVQGLSLLMGMLLVVRGRGAAK